MNEKNDSYSARRVPCNTNHYPGDGESLSERGYEWHSEYPYKLGMPYPFPIVLAGTRPKHVAVGHLTDDGTVHVFNMRIIEKLVRAGLRMHVYGLRETRDR